WCARKVNTIHLGKTCLGFALLADHAKHLLFLAWLQIREVKAFGNSELGIGSILIIPSLFRRFCQIFLVRWPFLWRFCYIFLIQRKVSWWRLWRWPLGLADTDHYCDPAFFLLCHFKFLQLNRD